MSKTQRVMVLAGRLARPFQDLARHAHQLGAGRFDRGGKFGDAHLPVDQHAECRTLALADDDTLLLMTDGMLEDLSASF